MRHPRHSRLLKSILFFILSCIILSPFVAEADPLNDWHVRNPLNDGQIYAVAYGNNKFVALEEDVFNSYVGNVMISADGLSWKKGLVKIGNVNRIRFGNNIFVAVGFQGRIITSPDGEEWTYRDSGIKSAIADVAYGNNLFVAVSWGGEILTSSDGTTWAKYDSGNSEGFNGIAYGNNTFVAVGYAGTIYTSTDGTTWTNRESDTTNTIRGIMYANNLFVAYGPSNILSSTDGLTWSNKAFDTPLPIDDMAYGNGLFIAVGGTWAGVSGDGEPYGNDTTLMMTSPDGHSWTKMEPGYKAFLGSIIFGVGSFIATGQHGTILVSSDGLSWSNVGLAKYATTENLFDIHYENNTFVAVGQHGAIITSPDGSTWTSNNSGSDSGLMKTAYGADIYVTVGWNGTILTSTDSINWTNRNSGTASHLMSVVAGNNIFVVVGKGGTILTSQDGIIWSSRESVTTSDLYDVTYGNGTFVAVGASGIILTSQDGLTWISRVSGASSVLQGVAYGSNTFIVVGQHGSIITSPDGMTWTTLISGVSNWLTKITYCSNTFVAVGWNAILTSTDGINWTSRDAGDPGTYDATPILSGVTCGNNTFLSVGAYGIIIESSLPSMFYKWNKVYPVSPLSADINAIAYGNGIFVAVGGAIYTSSDGIAWTERNSEVQTSLMNIVYGNGIFVAVGNTWNTSDFVKVILTSPNGVDWTFRDSGTNVNVESLNAITYGNSLFVAVGTGGAILTSMDGMSWSVKDSGVQTSFSDVTYGNNTFVAVGATWNNGSYAKVILTSPDGVVWTSRWSDPASASSSAKISFGNGMFTFVASQKIMTSSDGSAWATVFETSQSFEEIFYANGIFVGLGSGNIWTSYDGSTWTEGFYVDAMLTGMAYGNSKFVVVGRHGAVISSSVGQNWSVIAEGVSTIRAVAYGNDTYVAAGGSGLIYFQSTLLTSTDGKAWTKISVDVCGHFSDVSFGNGIFVAVGDCGYDSGYILTSPDGLTWTKRYSGNYGNLKGVTYGNGMFISVGTKGTILTSPDGLKWTKEEVGTADDFFHITFGHNMFIANRGIVGQKTSAAVSTSTDGKSWVTHTTPASLGTTAYGNNVFVSLSDWDETFFSNNGLFWSETSQKPFGFYNTGNVTFCNNRFFSFGDFGDNSFLYISDDGIYWSVRTFQPKAMSSTGGCANNRLFALAYDGIYMIDAPTISVTPSSLNFEIVAETGTPLSGVVTIANNGTIKLAIQSLTIAPSSESVLSLQNDNCSGKSLETSESCTATVVVSSASTDKKMATLNILSDNIDLPVFSVPLIVSAKKYLTVQKSGSGTGIITSSPVGINCGSECTAAYVSGTQITLTAAADTSSAFAGWSGDCSGTADTTTVTMDAVRTCTADFTLKATTGSVKINNDAVYTKSIAVTLTLSASDTDGVSQMCISNTEACASWVSYSTINQWTLTTDDGLKTVYVWFKDSQGNANAAPFIATIMLDTTTPVDGTLNAAADSGKINLSWSDFSDTTSGIGKYRLVQSASKSPANCTSTPLYYGTDTTYTHTEPAVGKTYYYRLCAEDNAGNISNGVTASVKAVPESSAPVGSLAINNGASYTKSSSVTLALSATDETASGIKMCVSNTSTCKSWTAFAKSKKWTLIKGDGQKTVYVWFRDKWGNTNAEPYTATITLDSKAPADGSLSATAGTGQVALNWSGFSDAASGVASYKVVYKAGRKPASCSGKALYSGTDIVYTHSGLTPKKTTTYNYRVCALDNAGNISKGATSNAKMTVQKTTAGKKVEAYESDTSDIGIALGETSDGGFIIADSLTPTDGQFRLLKIDSDGDEEWQRVYDDTHNIRVKSVTQAHDGGFLVAGMVEDVDVLLLGLGAQGNIESQSDYAESFPEKDFNGPAWQHSVDIAGKISQYALIQDTPDGGQVMIIIEPKDAGNTVVHLQRLDAQGNIRWRKIL